MTAFLIASGLALGWALAQLYSWERQARQGALEALRNTQPGRKKVDPTVQIQAEIERYRAAVAELGADYSWPRKALWA